MRLDIFLKTSRLIIRRSLAQKFCDAGLISVNDLPAKSSRSINTGDEIEIRRHNRVTKIRVLSVPEKKQLAKHDAPDLYQVISEVEVADDLLSKK